MEHGKQGHEETKMLNVCYFSRYHFTIYEIHTLF